MNKALKYLARSFVMKYIGAVLYLGLLPFIAMDEYVIVGLLGIMLLIVGVLNVVFDWLFIFTVFKKDKGEEE